MMRYLIRQTIAILVIGLFVVPAYSKSDYRTLEITDLPERYRYATEESLQQHPDILSQLQKKSETNKVEDQEKYVHTYKDMDVAISNLEDVYIVTRAPSDLVQYVMTRYGSMRWSGDGRLQIYDLTVQNANHLAHDIILPYPILPPNPTTTVRGVFNLNPYQSEFSPSVLVFDSHGDSRVIFFNFSLLSENLFSVSILDEQDEVFATGTLVFDHQGELTNSTGLEKITLPSNTGRSDPLEFSIKLNGTTNYSSVMSRVIHLQSNGYSAGELISTNIEMDGTLLAYYSSDIRVRFGQIHTTSEIKSELTPYMPLFPKNVWVPLVRYDEPREITFGTLFLIGYLEKSAYTLPDTHSLITTNP